MEPSTPLLLQKNQISILSIVPNLVSLNLSTNNLTNKSLQTLIKTSSHNVQNKDNATILPNLRTFNLSNNDLSQIPLEISKFCPNIVNLNLFNNDIQNMTNLEQLSNCHSLQCINLESNPLCLRDKLYREKIICFLGPTLRHCDGNTGTINNPNYFNGYHDDYNHQNNVINESRRYEAKAKLVTELEMIDEKLHKRKDRDDRERNTTSSSAGNSSTRRSLTASLQQKSKTLSIDSSQSDGKTSSNKKKCGTRKNDGRNTDHQIVNHDKTSSQVKRLKNTVETMSLQTLTSLETQVKKLSKLTMKQVDATNKLLDSQNHNQEQQSDSCVTNGDNKQCKVPIVCEANVQTTFPYDDCQQEGRELIGRSSPVPPPPSKGNEVSKNVNDSQEREMNKLSLECILLKWYVSVLKQRLNVRKNQGEKYDTKQAAEEMTKTDTQQFDDNEIKKRDDLIAQLKSELSESKQNIHEKEAEFFQYKKESELDIERIRSEATATAMRSQNNHFIKQKRDRDEYYDRKIREAKLHHDDEVQALERSLIETRKKMKQVQKKLEKSNLVIKDIELEKINNIEVSEVICE